MNIHSPSGISEDVRTPSELKYAGKSKANTSSSMYSPTGYQISVDNFTAQMYQEAQHSTNTDKQVIRQKIARRDLMYRSLDKAEAITESMVNHVKDDNSIELANKSFELQHILEDLWQIRSEREPDWVDLLSMIMVMMAQEDFDLFTLSKCKALQTIVQEHLKLALVDIHNLRECRKLLREAGFDPWKGISAK